MRGVCLLHAKSVASADRQDAGALQMPRIKHPRCAALNEDEFERETFSVEDGPARGDRKG